MVPGGSNDPMPSNNTLPVELNIIDKNDPNQTAVHETTIASLKPVTVTIAAGQTAKIKNVEAACRQRRRRRGAGRSDQRDGGRDGTCPPGTVGAVTFVGGASQVTVRGRREARPARCR